MGIEKELGSSGRDRVEFKSTKQHKGILDVREMSSLRWMWIL